MRHTSSTRVTWPGVLGFSLLPTGSGIAPKPDVAVPTGSAAAVGSARFVTDFTKTLRPAAFRVNLTNMKLADTEQPRPYVMRKRARAAAETADRILDAAVEVFAELPYAQLTLSEVASRAGVTVQTVIRRFGDKEGLVRAAAERTTTSISDQRNGAPVGDVSGIVDNLVEHYEQMGVIALRLLAEEDASPAIGDLTRAGRAYHRDWCARVFAPSLAGLAGVERERRLAQLVAVCDVYTWKLLRRDSGLSRRQTTTALLELLEPLVPA